MENLAITLIQSELAWEDKDKNLANFENYFRHLQGNTDLIILPEMFNTGFTVDPQDIAEDPYGPTFNWMKHQAGLMQCVITGSIAVHIGKEYFNRLLWMRPDGTHEVYDKRHLFRYGNEHVHFAPGSKRLVTELKGWKICPLVCYDLRFPVWSKNTFHEGNYEYDLLIYVSNWPGRRGYAFRQLLIARAIENQSFVIGINRIGRDINQTRYHGESVVLDYIGKPIIEMPPDVEYMDTVTLNQDKLSEFREHFPVALDWDSFMITNVIQ